MDTTKYSYIIIEVQKLSKYINPTNVAEAEKQLVVEVIYLNNK